MSVTIPEPPPTPLNRRQMMAERQERSLAWRAIYFLGSLKFAIYLLGAIAVACAVATFMESGTTTKLAHAYIYKAPWFLVGLGVLCVNLAAVTLTRWPWQKKHIGFVVTHYGIITLLAGAMIGVHTGFEGNVTLRLDAPPVSRVTTSRSIIQLESPADHALYTMPFSADTARLGDGHVRDFPIPGTELKVVADEFSPNLIRQEELVPSDNAEAGPGVLLTFSSGMMGQRIVLPLVLEGGASVERDFFGMAKVVMNSGAEQTLPLPRETQMVFSKFAPVISGPISSGVTVQLDADGDHVSIFGKDGVGATYVVKEVLKRPVIEGDAVVTIDNYWPDFAMINGQPATKSDKPNNPAILVHITKDPSAKAKKPTLAFTAGDGKISYQLSRNGQEYAQSEAAAGTTFPLGWADWQTQVTQVLPKAVITSETMPGPALAKGAQGIPGFRAYLADAGQPAGPAQWIESGRVVSLVNGSHVVRFGYGLETVPVPFSLRLVKFEVPRDEGSDAPSDFRATVEFRDARTGETKTGVARMNHPASFPGTLWANLTGINYKFSQAEWNPRNLDETTLQVLYDPGWLLKWIGSLGICIGIAIMFYWKPTKS